jgi:hypothetical protein
VLSFERRWSNQRIESLVFGITSTEKIYETSCVVWNMAGGWVCPIHIFGWGELRLNYITLYKEKIK